MLGNIFCLAAPSCHALLSTAPYSSDGMSVSHNRPHHVSSRRILQTACPSPTSNLADFQASLLFEILGCTPKNRGIEVDPGTTPQRYILMTTCRWLMSTVIQAKLPEICRIGIGYMCIQSDVHRKLTQSR